MKEQKVLSLMQAPTIDDSSAMDWGYRKEQTKRNYKKHELEERLSRMKELVVLYISLFRSASNFKLKKFFEKIPI